MNSYRGIALRYLVKNRARSMSIIVSIALSLALVVGFGVLLNSAQKTDIEKMRYECGREHVVFHKVTTKQLAKIKEYQALFKQTGINSVYGYYYFPQKGCLFLCCADQGYMRINGSKIIKGRFPSRPGEIALDEWSFEALGLRPEINQKIMMDIDYRGAKSQEEFVVVGITQDRVREKASSIIEGLIPRSQVRKEESDTEFSVEFKPDVTIDKTVKKIAKAAAIDGENIESNNMLLTAIEEAKATDWKNIYLWIVVFLLSFFVISGIHSLSIYRRIQDYGMLRIIGATKRQIRSVIYLEMSALLLLGIPTGILLGIAAAYGLSGIAGQILVEGGVQIQRISISMAPIISGVLVVLAAVAFALIKTIIMLEKVSPLEATRINAQMTGNNGKRTRRGFLENKLNVTQRIVIRHLSRNRKSTAVIIMSMALASILFMSVSMYGVLDKANMQNNLEISDFNYDFKLVVSILNPMMVGFNDQAITAMRDIPGVKEVLSQRLMYSELLLDDREITDKDYFKYINSTPFYKDVLKGLLVKKGGKDQCILKNNLWGYDDDELKQLRKYLIQGEINIEKIKSGSTVVLTLPEDSQKPALGIKTGDTVKVRFQKNNEPYYIYDDNQYINKEFKVGAIVSHALVNEDFRTGSNSADIIMDGESFKKYVGYDNYRVVSINKQKGAAPEPIHQQLRVIANNIPDTLLLDLNLEKASIIDLNQQIGIFLYGIIMVLFLIGMINILNSINFNFLSRKKEFALMRAVGLTRPQLNSMIIFEGLFFGVMSALSAVCLGTAIQIVIYNLLKTVSLKYPVLWKPYILVILMNILISLAATYLAGYRIARSNVMDSIREN